MSRKGRQRSHGVAPRSGGASADESGSLERQSVLLDDLHRPFEVDLAPVLGGEGR
jgi:hypothetical protein